MTQNHIDIHFIFLFVYIHKIGYLYGSVSFIVIITIIIICTFWRQVGIKNYLLGSLIHSQAMLSVCFSETLKKKYNFRTYNKNQIQ